MSLRNKFKLQLPRLDPRTPEDHRQNINRLSQWAQDIPLNERVRASVRRTTNLDPITTNTVTEIPWQVANEGTDFPSDPFGFFNLTVSANRLTCPQGLGGLYIAEAAVRYTGSGGSANTVTNAIWGIRRNGVTMRRRHEQYAIGLASFYCGPLYTNFELLPGDYVTVWVYHESAANRALEAVTQAADTSFEPQLILARISS